MEAYGRKRNMRALCWRRGRGWWCKESAALRSLVSNLHQLTYLFVLCHMESE